MTKIVFLSYGFVKNSLVKSMVIFPPHLVIFPGCFCYNWHQSHDKLLFQNINPETGNYNGLFVPKGMFFTTLTAMHSNEHTLGAQIMQATGSPNCYCEGN